MLVADDMVISFATDDLRADKDAGLEAGLGVRALSGCAKVTDYVFDVPFLTSE